MMDDTELRLAELLEHLDSCGEHARENAAGSRSLAQVSSGERFVIYTAAANVSTEQAKRFARWADALREARKDTARMDWMEARCVEEETMDLHFTEAWSETGDYGTVLSSGPREFWLHDEENGPTLRAAIDAAAMGPAGREEREEAEIRDKATGAPAPVFIPAPPAAVSLPSPGL